MSKYYIIMLKSWVILSMKHGVDKSTAYDDKIACLCKIITHYVDKFTCFLDNTPRGDKIK